MEQPLYICRHCGNIVAMIRDVGVPIFCCGEEMAPAQGDSGPAGEKHAPVWRTENGIVHVQVGRSPHPMEPEHFIQWIRLETDHGIQYAQLAPDREPKAQFALCPGDLVRAVWALCDRHGLWKTEKESHLCQRSIRK